MTTPCEHTWKLEERGYIRTWHIEMNQADKSITAHYCGSTDWSDDGDGELRLVCASCLETKAVPDGWEINFA